MNNLKKFKNYIRDFKFIYFFPNSHFYSKNQISINLLQHKCLDIIKCKYKYTKFESYNYYLNCKHCNCTLCVFYYNKSEIFIHADYKMLDNIISNCDDLLIRNILW